MRRLAPVFACLLVLLLGFAGYQAAFVPVAAIRVEINRAVELGVNRLGRVVSSSGLNEDGEALAEEENVWFLPYGEAIDRLLENSRVANCLAQGETVSIGVGCARSGSGSFPSRREAGRTAAPTWKRKRRPAEARGTGTEPDPGTGKARAKETDPGTGTGTDTARETEPETETDAEAPQRDRINGARALPRE